MKKVKILFVLSVIVFAFAGCNSCNQKKNIKKQIINIAAVLPLTGTSANIGKWQKQGIELAVENYNASHLNEGKVSVKFEDSQSDPKFGVSAFEKLNTGNENSGYLFSLSGVANAILPQLNKNPKPSMLLAVSLPKITDKSDYAYRFHLGSEDEAIAMSEFMTENKYDSIAVVYLNDEFGVGALEVFKEKFESKGGHVTSVETYTKEQTDFKSIVTKLKSSKQQGVYVIGYVQASVLCIKQMRELGFSKQVFANMALSVPSFIKTGGDALNGAIYTVTRFNANDTSKVVSNFVSEYKKKYSEDPTFFTGFAFDATNIMIQNLALSTDLVKPTVIQVENYTGVMGNVSVNAKRNFQFPIKIVRNDNGQIVYVAQ